MKKEKREGGKLISSIESLDFIVTSEKDVDITVKDTEGWQLHQPSLMVVHMAIHFYVKISH